MASESSNISQEKRIVRVWMDGCFDLVHYGHANAFRQAKELGDYLIVGVHSDAIIRENKGQPVSTEQERYKLVRAIKWVDEVIEDAPYVPTLETLDKYNCQFCVHGDDPTLETDGTDCHEPVKTASRYKDIARTLGISTTGLVKKMLLMNKANEEFDHILEGSESIEDAPAKLLSMWLTNAGQSPYMVDNITVFPNSPQPKPNGCIIYAPGIFDVFHGGHVDFLQKARAMGDYLIVGLYKDEDINRYRSNKKLIMNINERALSVLACRFVDEVAIGVPYFITMDLIDRFKIDWVVQGQFNYETNANSQDPFQVPKSLGKFKLIDSENLLKTTHIIARVSENRLEYETRNSKKIADELQGQISFSQNLKKK